MAIKCCTIVTTKKKKYIRSYNIIINDYIYKPKYNICYRQEDLINKFNLKINK